MISKILIIAAAVLIFCLMIVAHEFGHYISAKLLGVKVLEFSLGMGPLLWHRQKGETQYSLRLLPLGGFCKMEGEDEDSDDPRSFQKQPALSKIIILVAGALMNMIMAYIIIFIVFSTVSRFGYALKVPFLIFGDYVKELFAFFGRLFQGNVQSNDVMGVVGMVNVISEEAQYGFSNVAFLMGLISFNLGCINLLPFPALDGGRIVFVILRWITKDKIGENAELITNAIGMVLLIGLMIFLIIKDTVSLF